MHHRQGMDTQTNIEVTTHRGRRIARSGNRWEHALGYSRAVRRDSMIFVTGTVGVNDDGTFPDDIADQARRSLEIIQAAVEALGGTMADIVRTRMFVTDIRRWKELRDVHCRHFGESEPGLTLVEISKLIDEDAMIEIEADAVVTGEEA